MSVNLTHVSGAGNRFGLADLFRGDALPDAPATARRLASERGLDGLLVLGAPRAGGVARLEIFNADGSRAAACGNGLRCAARRWFEDVALGFAPPFDGELPTIETEAGARGFELVDWFEERAIVRVSMGRPEPVELVQPVVHRGRELRARGVRLGNVHCVFTVDDERDAPVDELGHALQQHPSFPDGVNAGFLARRAGGFHLRVYERGVGETLACGSGACAAAFASEALSDGPVELHMPGGVLIVEREPSGELALCGEALEHERIELDTRRDVAQRRRRA